MGVAGRLLRASDPRIARSDLSEALVPHKSDLLCAPPIIILYSQIGVTPRSCHDSAT